MSKGKNVEIRQEPEEDAERDDASDRFLLFDGGGQPGHRSPKQRMVGEIKNGEDHRINAVLRSQSDDVVPEVSHEVQSKGIGGGGSKELALSQAAK